MLRVVEPVLISSDHMIADGLTKPLDRARLGKLRAYMLNQDRGLGTMGALSADARRKKESRNNCVNWFKPTRLTRAVTQAMLHSDRQ